MQSLHAAAALARSHAGSDECCLEFAGKGGRRCGWQPVLVSRLRAAALAMCAIAFTRHTPTAF
eukprot:365540-Chlamydomonas_euryale.AAC.14